MPRTWACRMIDIQSQPGRCHPIGFTPGNWRTGQALEEWLCKWTAARSRERDSGEVKSFSPNLAVRSELKLSAESVLSERSEIGKLRASDPGATELAFQTC